MCAGLDLYIQALAHKFAEYDLEVRLVEFAQSTRVRYADMGVFSAVARNQ